MNQNLRPAKTTQLKGYDNTPEKEERPDALENSKPLNKEQVQKQLAVEGEDDLMDTGYDPELDPVPAVIFDSELQFIKQLKAVDIVFLIDATGSMSPYMKGVKRFTRKILWDVQKCLTQYLVDEVEVLLVGLVTYKDHSTNKNSYVSKIDCDLTSNFNDFKANLMRVQAKGGGDEPEAVLDGLNEAIMNISWRENSFKFVYHILDGPPHGKELNVCKNDNYPECPCGLNYEDILREMRNREIEYTIIQLSDTVDTMVKSFQEIMKIEGVTPDIKCDKSKAISQDD